MPLPIIGWICYTCIAAGVTYCTHKVAKAYNKGQKNKKRKYELKGKTIDQAQEDNKKAQVETNEWKKKYEENETRIKDLEKNAEEAGNKAKDPNLSEEERIVWRNKSGQFNDEATSLRTNNKSILDKIKGLENRIKDNNKIISGASSNVDDKHWIWDLITLENVMILGGCYVLYRLIREEKEN